MKLTKKTVDALTANGRDIVYWDDEVKRFGLRVRSSGAKSFIIQYRNAQGRSRKYTVGQYSGKEGTWTPDLAREEAKRLLRLADQGNDPAEAAQSERTAITVSELCDKYMEAARKGTVAPKGKPKKASTLYVDESRISAHIKPLLGKKLVKDLTQADVRRFYEDVVGKKHANPLVKASAKKRGKSIVKGGGTAAKRCVGLLGGMLGYAVLKGYRSEGFNPAHKIGMADDRRRQFRLEIEGWRTYSEAIEAGRQNGEAWQAIGIAQLLALTGCRHDEIASLQWAEVDFQSRCFRFKAARIKGGQLRPIGQAALDLLKNLKPSAAEGKASAYVFPATRGKEDKPYAGFKKVWKRFGLDFTPHCLRHAFASAAEDDCGLHESTVEAIIGHKKRGSNVTRGYVMKADATLLAAADKVSRYVWQAMTGEAVSADIVPFKRA